MVTGCIDDLRECLDQRPDLVRERSPYAHRSTLLHYVAANGVEIWRQRSPRNAASIARLLIERGSQADALCECYGGGRNATTLSLAVSSVHPHAKGVQAEIATALIEGGASVHGLKNDNHPLATAMAFGYLDTARALVQHGARVDNIVLAAGLGDRERVANMLDEHGDVIEEQVYADPFGERVSDGSALKDRALFLGAKLGHADVVRLLIESGADLDVAPARGESALHWAAFLGHEDVVRLLVEHGAAKTRRDATWNSTPRIWAAEGKHEAIVEFLEGEK